jgi:hypothetical protein
MGRPRSSWLLAVPLIVSGSLIAHELAYWFAGPRTAAGGRTFTGPDHGYLDHAPLALGVLGAMLLASLLGRAVRAFTGRPTLQVPAWPFFLLPPTAFAIQEHLERLLGNGDALHAVLEPTFLVGLVLQLPFALAAYGLARLLTEVAETVGRAIAVRFQAALPRRTTAVRPAERTASPRVAQLALGYAQRGPPLPA